MRNIKIQKQTTPDDDELRSRMLREIELAHKRGFTEGVEAEHLRSSEMLKSLRADHEKAIHGRQNTIIALEHEVETLTNILQQERKSNLLLNRGHIISLEIHDAGSPPSHAEKPLLGFYIDTMSILRVVQYVYDSYNRWYVLGHSTSETLSRENKGGKHVFITHWAYAPNLPIDEIPF